MVIRLCWSRKQMHDELSALTLYAEVRRWFNMYGRRRELAYRRMIFHQIDETTQHIENPLLQIIKNKSFDDCSRCYKCSLILP